MHAWMTSILFFNCHGHCKDKLLKSIGLYKKVHKDLDISAFFACAI